MSPPTQPHTPLEREHHALPREIKTANETQSEITMDFPSKGKGRNINLPVMLRYYWEGVCSRGTCVEV